MIKPNLPDKLVKKVIVSCDISGKIELSLKKYGIDIIKLQGKMNCDPAVRNHPDLYITHCDENVFLFAKNICSVAGDCDIKFTEIEISTGECKIKYPDDVFMNSTVIGKNIIGCKKYMHKNILSFAEENDYRIINVNQGYAKCNICVVDENSVITEDVGIAKILSDYDFDVLLLENKVVRLSNYPYGFIGGASGKLSGNILGFYGNVFDHPEFNRIESFLTSKGVEPISLSDDPLTDYGSLIPVI